MKIGIVSDHRGFNLKKELLEYLKKENYEVFDYGSYSTESVDYPKYGFILGEKVSNHEVDFGIAICGSGIGISIACNKVKNIRCAKVDNSLEAYHTRMDNDSNIIAISGEMDVEKAIDIIKVFLNTGFSNSERHIRRIKQISMYESGEEIES